MFGYESAFQIGSEVLTCEDYLGRTPLHYAALVGDTDHSLYNWLVEKGSDTTIKDKVTGHFV